MMRGNDLHADLWIAESTLSKLAALRIMVLKETQTMKLSLEVTALIKQK